MSSTDSQYTYSAVITNNGPAELGVTSNVTSSSSSVLVVEGTLVFGSVDANGTRASANTFTIQQSSQATFDPSVLTWNSGAVGTPVPISLLDSGQYDATTGDGIYTGSFVPPTSGEYTASLQATGTSGGAAFSRTATTKFQVNDPNASLGAFSDAPVDTNGNGLTDIVNVTAAVTVQSAGSYRFTMNLRASNGMTMAANGTAALAAGPQQVTVGFPASGLIGMGVDGPYERVSALLLQEVGTSEAVAGYSADAGATQAYPLSSFDRGPMYFNGQNSAAGIVTGQGSTFDILRVQLGVTFAPPPPGTFQWDCSWEGTLSDSNGAQIDFATGNTAYSAGFSSGNQAITLDFNGNRIAQSGQAGPYIVSGVGLHCDGVDLFMQTPFSTQSFTVSQFTNAAPDFVLGGQPAVRAIAQGETVEYKLNLTALGGFQGMVNFTATSFPQDASGVLGIASLPGSGIFPLDVTTATTTPTGVYSIPVGYSSGVAEKSLTLTLTVTSGDVSILMGPPNPGPLQAGQTQQFYATVQNTSNDGVIWSLSSPIGTIDATGLYTAPSSIASPTSLYVVATAVVDSTISQSILLTVTP